MCFTFVDIAGFGRDNDAALLKESQFGQAFENCELSLPDTLQIGGNMLPYFGIGDPIFRHKSKLMKAFGGNNLSEEERYSIIDSQEPNELLRILLAFGPHGGGYLVGQSVPPYPRVKAYIMKATICLYNYLRTTANAMHTPKDFVDSEDNLGDITPGQWRSIFTNSGSDLSDISRLWSNRYSFEASNIRSNLKSYCNSLEESVSWQLNNVRSCCIRNQDNIF